MLRFQVPAMRKSGEHYPAVQTTASIVSLVTQRQMPTIKKTPKTVEIIHVVQRQRPSSRRSRRSLSYTRCDERASACDSDAQKTWKLPEIQYIIKIVVFPWRCNTRFPQFQCDEQQMSVIQMSKTSRGVPTGPAN